MRYTQAVGSGIATGRALGEYVIHVRQRGEEVLHFTQLEGDSPFYIPATAAATTFCLSVFGTAPRTGASTRWAFCLLSHVDRSLYERQAMERRGGDPLPEAWRSPWPFLSLPLLFQVAAELAHGAWTYGQTSIKQYLALTEAQRDAATVLLAMDERPRAPEEAASLATQAAHWVLAQDPQVALHALHAWKMQHALGVREAERGEAERGEAERGEAEAAAALSPAALFRAAEEVSEAEAVLQALSGVRPRPRAGNDACERF